MSQPRIYARILSDFDERKFRDLLERFSTGQRSVLVGFPAEIERQVEGDAKPPDLTVAQIAAIHEFGAPNAAIPERPFLRPAIADNREKFFALNRVSLKGVMDGSLTMQQALGRLGAIAQAQVQKKIVQGPFRPLEPKTIARKGSTKPLIDSGQMRQSVQWVIEE